MDWYELVYLKSSKNRKHVLKALETNALTPTELAKKLDNHRSTISQVLLDLKDHGFVDCKTPKRHNYRVYSITKKGKEYLKKSI
ncbi:MAG: ArsR family transcriptional regulator [Candidatus Diapherotrites archaeon]|nr:ArsR family transcriptional regulator [Candidatus Diapherotrites archaeon]